jgi:organic radical activating enzyme
LPWKSVYVHPDGSIRPCCIQTLKYGDTKNGDTIESTWNSSEAKKIRKSFIEGQFLSGCEPCRDKELYLGKSIRTSFLDNYKNAVNVQDINFEKLSEQADLDIVHLDLSFSNLCNLKCRFCGPHNSSSWFTDASELLKLDRAYWIPFMGKSHSLNVQKSQDYTSIVKKLKKLKKIEMQGGEPFLSKEQIPFLQALIEADLAKEIELYYTTNGTVILPEIKHLFPKFKQITISVSVDGTGDLYKYIRGGDYSLELDVENNLQFYSQFQNLNLIIHYTLCAYNIFGVAKMIEWFNGVKIRNKNIKKWQIGLVVNPSPLRISRLPVEIRKKALFRLESYSSPALHSLRQSLNGTTSNDENSLWFPSFQKYVNDLDSIRKTSFLTVAPEFSEYWTQNDICYK